MKAYFLYVVGVVATLGLCTVMPGPEPPAIKVHAPTPEELTAQFNAEQRQKEYDQAEEMAARVLTHHGCDDEFAELISHQALDHNLSPRLVAAVVVVESTCRAGVVSKEGACGLMQVSAKVWHTSCEYLKDPATNVLKGTEILQAYIRRAGSVKEGLHRYNGLGEGCEACDADYPTKVLTVAYSR